ncbi:hypothetical protein OHD13_16635 [Escherichia coli]|nr:hypothetical protein [Escherichia coli]MCW7229614.1 hypothetical protein [Escherichia coli]
MSHRHQAGLLLYAGFRLPSQIPLRRFPGRSLTLDDATADMVVHRHLLTPNCSASTCSPTIAVFG